MSKFREVKVDTLVFLYLSFNENCDQVMVSFLRKIFKPLILLFSAKNKGMFKKVCQSEFLVQLNF